MMKRILLSGAALTAFASLAVAQTPPATEPATPPAGMSAPAATTQAEAKDPNLFSSMKGASVLGENDETVGTVADALVTPSGDLRAVVLSHGGFVGIGQSYRQYDVSELPLLSDDQVKIGGLTTASVESIPEYTYPEAEGRAATGAAPASGTDGAPAETPAMPLADGTMIPVTNLIGAVVKGSPNDASIDDLRFEGNKVAGAILNDDAKTEVAFSDLEILGSAADPEIAMSAGGGTSAPSTPDAGAAAPGASAPAPMAPASPAN